MKEKQPYEKPKMTFVENQPERRKSLKKEKIVPVRFTNWQYECLQNEAREHGYGANISGYIRSQVLVDHTTPQLSKEIRKCEYQINRIVNNIKQCKNSIYVTKEEQKILQEYIEKIYMGQQQCYGKYHIYSKDNQEKLLELEKELKAVGYEIFDILRVDHFRAFDTYWSVPYGSATAREGKWIEGPSYHFLDSVYKQLPKLNMIVEDLGELRPQVHELRDHYDLLGMKVMQFSFGEDERKVKYKIPQHCVVYTGTHDNATLKQWYEELDDKERMKEIMKGLGYTGENLVEDMLAYTLECDAVISIVPLQDLLGYGKEARINLPGTVGPHNWSYKLTSFDDYQNQIQIIQKMLKKAKR